MTHLTETKDTDMASWNHGFLQGQLFMAFRTLVKNYTPNIELSLDVSKHDLSKFALGQKDELRPAVCLYPAEQYRGFKKPYDIVRMSDMPHLAVEIVSPRQGIMDLKEKLEVYFHLGIKSCWLILPELEDVTVYQSLTNYKLFSPKHGDTEVIDDILNIRLPLNKIFEE